MMNEKTTKNISSEGIIAIVAVALVLTPLIVFSLLSIYKVSQSLTDIIENEIEAKSILVAHDINSFIHERIIDAKVISQADVLEGQDNHAKTQYLTEIITENKWINDIDIISETGKVIASSGIHKDNAFLDLFPIDKSLFLSASKARQGQVYVSEALSLDTGPGIVVMTPITDDQNIKLIGLLAIEVNLKYIANIVALFEQGIVGDKHVYIVDNDGRVIISADPSVKFLDLFPDLKTNPELLDAFSLQGEIGNIIYTDHTNVQVMAGYADMAEFGENKALDWSLIAIAPMNEITAPVTHLKQLLLIIGSIIALLSGFLAYRAISFINKSMANLATQADAISQGDFSAPQLPESNRKGAFNTLVIAINRMQKNIHQLIDKLQDREQRLNITLNSIGDGVIVIDDNGNVQSLNPAAISLFGYSLDELQGQNIKVLMPSSYHSEHDHYLSNQLSTDENKIIGLEREVVGLRKNGTEFPLELAFSPVQMDNTLHFIGITRDITERKRNELMQKEFISTVSHELRTPLTSISGSLGLILGGVTGALSDKTRALITIANNNSKRLIHLINDILDIEKISAGKMQFNFSVVSLVPLITKSLEENKGYGEKLKVSFKLVNNTEKEVKVRVDDKRLMQVMSNLLSNAAKYSPSGGEVEIKVEQIGENACVSIHDHGKGIPEEFKSKIFSKFSQADSSDTRQKGGTGLGLNITQAIVLEHKGSINFDSNEGQGTTFYVNLPLFDEEEKTEIPIKKNDDNKPLILIVEDDYDVSKLLSIMLENEGYQLDQAYDYEQASQKIKKNKYDAITLDLMIPGGSGISILRELRRHADTLQLPVIVVSAVVNEGRMEVEGDAFEMVDWIEKPIDADRLVETIKSSLSASSSRVGKILHVEDDPDITAIVTSLLGDDFEVTNASTLSQAKSMLSDNTFDLVLLDVGLPDGSGLDLLPVLLDDGHQIPVVIFSAQDVPQEIASKVMATLVKSKTDNDNLLLQIKQAISRKLN